LHKEPFLNDALEHRIAEGGEGPSGALVSQVQASLKCSQTLRQEYELLVVSTADAAFDATSTTSSSTPSQPAIDTEAIATAAFKRVCDRKGLNRLDQRLLLTLQPSLLRITLYHGTLSELLRLQKTKYDKTVVEHEQVLLRLWKAMEPQEELTARVSKQWQAIGFQGDDPSTDFRGMGLLGLYALVSFAEKHQPLAASILVTSQHPARWFPLAITGIQIGQMILVASQDGTLNRIWLSSSKPTSDIYFDLFAFAMERFGDTWHKSDATILDFPAVFDGYKVSLLSHLGGLETVPRLIY